MKLLLFLPIFGLLFWVTGCGPSGPNYPAAPGTMGATASNSMDRDVDQFYSEVSRMPNGSGN